MRRMYITPAMILKHGTTDGCPKCEKYGADHSAECRGRFEKIMIESGEAFRSGGPEQNPVEKRAAVDIQSAPQTPSASPAPAAGPPPKRLDFKASPARDPGAAMSVGAVTMIAAVMEAPVVELWRDKKAWASGSFPRNKLQMGREREVENIVEFDAVEDTTLGEGERAFDTTWVEEWRGEEVRSRPCVREYATERRDDLFSPTPDSFSADSS